MTEMESPKRHRPSPLGSGGYIDALIILVILIGLIALIVVKRQDIQDWFRLLGYHPPAAVVNLANDDTMTPYTRHLFYLNKPQLLPTVTGFREDCKENKNTIVLGCYHTGENGIFIYNVQDPTLAGVQQVTAAHEVLHAIYARLSNSARKTLDNELESYYKNGLTDSMVKAEVAIYQKTEPGDVMDEMSCTFGTEIANLPAALNNYYKQYFSNRQVIIAYENQYQGEFTSRENTINSYDDQLSSMKNSINSQTAELSSEDSTIDSEEAQLSIESKDGDTAAYNAALPAYNQLVDSYNAQVSSVQALVNQYNELVVTRNQVAGQLTTLDKALDTRLTTHQAQ